MRTRLARVLPFLLVLVISAACSNHQEVLRGSLATLNAARDGFLAWDDAHQSDIVKHATSLESGKADLARYRDKREEVVRAFELAYKVIATAAVDPNPDNLAMLATNLRDLVTTAHTLGITWGQAKGPP